MSGKPAGSDVRREIRDVRREIRDVRRDRRKERDEKLSLPPGSAQAIEKALFREGN
jgi:hypothetical protein